MTPFSQGVAIRTQEDSPWACDHKLLRRNAYSNASYEVILTSEICHISCLISVSSPRYSIKSYGSFILLKADSADSVNLVLGGFTYYPPPDYYGSVEIDMSVAATDSDNINRSRETASLLIFVEPVDDAPEEVVRLSSPYLNGKDVRDAAGVQLQLFDAMDVDDVLLMNVEFSCSYGIFSIPPQITRNSALFVCTLNNSLEAEKVLSICTYASNLTSTVDSIVYTPISAYHGKDTINLRNASLEPNLLDSTAPMVLSRANAAGMSLQTGAVISSLPYIPGKYATNMRSQRQIYLSTSLLCFHFHVSRQ